MNAPSVLTLATTALRRSAHFALRRLSVEGNQETLILTGRVPSHYLKQMAQETIRSHALELAIVNQVDVVAASS